MLFLSVLNLSAQEMLVDLNGNPQLGEAWEKVQRSGVFNSRAAGDTLELPFFDDFSEPFSRLQTGADLYPNQNLWEGYTVYVNNHMAINPISQGVATFDGLDERGLAYGFGFAIPFVSDSITSKPINLENAVDTVYLSFYYQAQGMGNAPEEEDILTLEFKSRPTDSTEEWVRVWEVEGYILEDYDFNRVILPIIDSMYLYNGFQFRFRNYASRAGSVDHWHLDYVELDENRSVLDTDLEDLSFMPQTSYSDTGLFTSFSATLLREFSSMPWSHYLASDTSEFMLDSVYLVLRNNFLVDKQLQFAYRVKNENSVEVYAREQNTGVAVYAGRICGSEFQDCNDETSGNIRNDLETFYFPHAVADSVFFEVEYQLPNTNDAVITNDKLVFKQEFYNYYAYDDGTAEVGYGLGELENVGRVAVRYNIKKDDYIRAIQLYLNPIQYDLSNEPVQLVIWEGETEPTDTMWTSEVLNLQYTERVNAFYHYMVNRDVPVQAGQNIWVGWIQQPATDQKFSIGFDRRADNSDKVYYNLGNGWSQSSIPGSVMIRPVVGDPYEWVGVSESQKLDLVLYPNPTTGMVYLQGLDSQHLRNTSIRVFDITGREVYSQHGYTNGMDLATLNAGTYLVNVKVSDGQRITKRIVLQ